MLEDKKVFIFGYSGHAYVIIESLIEMGYSIEGYFDFEEATVNPYGLTYYGFEKKVAVQEIVKNSLVFPTVGDNVIRKKLVHFFEELRLNQFTVIDKSANVSKTAQIGYSTYIGKNTAINAQSKIGYTKTAPVPSPKRIFICKKGCSPSSSKIILTPGSSLW